MELSQDLDLPLAGLSGNEEVLPISSSDNHVL